MDIPNKQITFYAGAISCIVAIFLSLISCDDFFEKDLEGKEVEIISPGDSLKTQYSTQKFWWEELDGASFYNLQIVSPSFDKVEKVLIDTSLTETKFTFTLYPGTFQWRVRPANGSSEGDYQIRSIEIDTTLDLRGQEVVLRRPLADFATKEKSIKFYWDKLYNADDYRLDIKSGDWEGENVISPVIIPHDTVTINLALLPDGTYFWGIKALNNGSSTTYSTRKFYIDNIAPKTPVLAEPSDSTSVNDWPVTLKWTNTPDSGSPIYDSLVVATDRYFKSESVKFNKKIEGQSESVSLTGTGKFFWKVFSVDAAGNVSTSSKTNLVIVGSIETTSLNNEK